MMTTAEQYDETGPWRSRVDIARHRFGAGASDGWRPDGTVLPEDVLRCGRSC